MPDSPFARWSSDDPKPLSDGQAINQIHNLLDGREWTVDMLEQIADIVRLTSREIREPLTGEEMDEIGW
jgi:hypothetical protein